MFGAFILMAAGFGVAATAESPQRQELSMSGSSTRESLDTSSAGQTNDVKVSRSFERSELIRQGTLQMAQRERALKELDGRVGDRQVQLKKTAERQNRARLKAAEQRRNQWVLPVVGYTLTARFGKRSSLWSSGMHTGLDFAGPSGTKDVALAAGTVKSAGYSGAYGNRTVFTLVDGTDIWYCHQSRIAVKPGQPIGPGQVIGYTGSTGNVTGPHLHLEVHPGGGAEGTAVDPFPVLVQHGIRP